MNVKDTPETFVGEHIVVNTIKNLMSLGYTVCYYDNNKKRLDLMGDIFMYKTKNSFMYAPITISGAGQLHYDVSIFVNPGKSDLNVKELRATAKLANMDLFIPEE